MLLDYHSTFCDYLLQINSGLNHRKKSFCLGFAQWIWWLLTASQSRVSYSYSSSPSFLPFLPSLPSSFLFPSFFLPSLPSFLSPLLPSFHLSFLPFFPFYLSTYLPTLTVTPTKYQYHYQYQHQYQYQYHLLLLVGCWVVLCITGSGSDASALITTATHDATNNEYVCTF